MMQRETSSGFLFKSASFSSSPDLIFIALSNTRNNSNAQITGLDDEKTVYTDVYYFLLIVLIKPDLLIYLQLLICIF